MQIHQPTEHFKINKFSAVIALASGLFSASAAKADDSTVKEKETAQVVMPLVLPYIDASELNSTLQLPVAGISLIKESKATALLNQIKDSLLTNSRTEPSLVSTFLNLVASEPETEIPGERLRSLVALYPEVSVRQSILSYVYKSANITMSDATLAQFWSSKDAKIIEIALLNKSKTIKADVPSNFFDQVKTSTIPDECRHGAFGAHKSRNI
jgi:outer membrane PBP1 activator LpoA protein